MLQIYIYDEDAYIKPFNGMRELLLENDFTYNTTKDYCCVVFMKIGYVNDVQVYLQLNVLNEDFRPILIYDDSKYSLNYIHDLADDIQIELKNCGCVLTYLIPFRILYKMQGLMDTKLARFQKYIHIKTGKLVVGEQLRTLAKLSDLRYKTILKLNSINNKLNNLGFDSNIFPEPEAGKYMNVNEVEYKLNYRTDFDMGKITNNLKFLESGKVIYPNYLNYLKEKLNLAWFKIFTLNENPEQNVDENIEENIEGTFNVDDYYNFDYTDVDYYDLENIGQEINNNMMEDY